MESSVALLCGRVNDSTSFQQLSNNINVSVFGSEMQRVQSILK
jgi:hypothetical protein